MSTLIDGSIKWSLERSVASGVELLSMTDIKGQLRLPTTTDEDSVLRGFGIAAATALEDAVSCALLTQTLILRLDKFPTYELWLPRPPLQSVTTVAYIDTLGNSQTVAASNYTEDITGQPVGRIVPVDTFVWPSTDLIPNAVTITYEAGYGDDPEDVPLPLRLAALLMVGDFYDHREYSTELKVSELPWFQRLVGNYTCYWHPRYV